MISYVSKTEFLIVNGFVMYVMVTAKSWFFHKMIIKRIKYEFDKMMRLLLILFKRLQGKTSSLRRVTPLSPNII